MCIRTGCSMKINNAFLLGRSNLVHTALQSVISSDTINDFLTPMNTCPRPKELSFPIIMYEDGNNSEEK